MNLVEKDKHVLLDFSLLDGTQSSSQVLNQVISILVSKDLLPKSSWLLEVRVGVWMGPSASQGIDLFLGPGEASILLWSTQRGWLVVVSLALVSIVNPAISLVVRNLGSVGAVDWNLSVVSTKSMSVGVGV